MNIHLSNSKKRSILFCIAATAVYLIILNFLGKAGRLLLQGLADSYWVDGIERVIMTLLTIWVLAKLNKTDILKKKGTGFISGLITAGFILFIIFLAFMSNLSTVPSGSSMRSVISILGFIFSSIAVGLTEEILCRGLIINVLADCFGLNTRRGIWLTAALSGLIFGLAHFTNIFSDNRTAISVMLQCLNAAGIGMYFGAVYIRCGSLWPLIFVHALNDFVYEIQYGIWGIGSTYYNSDSYTKSLITIVIYILLTAFLLRRKKIKHLLSDSSDVLR